MNSKLADLILEMSYSDLVMIATDFSDMVNDEVVNRKVVTPHDFAELLHDWAQAQG